MKSQSSIWQEIWDALQGKEQEYTKGSVNRAILLLAIPMVLEMLMEGLFAVVDAYFVSRISNEAVTTVGLTETVATLIYSVALGIGIAATAMVSRRIGEGKKEEAAQAAFQAILLGVLTSVVFSVGGILFASQILTLLGASAEVVSSGTTYTQILLGSNAVIMLLFILNGIFRGAGDAGMAMVSLWIANLLNMVLDPLFIFGWGPFPEWGLKGAAVATTIGRGTGVAFQLLILFGGSRVIRLGLQQLKVIPEMLQKLVNVASTGAGQYLIASASWLFLSRIVAGFGTDVYAGYTFAIRIVIFTLLPAWGLANAAATLVGQNLGAGKPERAETSAWRSAWFNMTFMVIVGALFFLRAEELIRIFSDNAIVVQSGASALRVFCAGYLFFAHGMVIGQAFGGAGDTRTPTLVNFICFWLIEIPLSYLLAKKLGFGPSGVYWAIALSEALMAVILVLQFQKGRWKQVQI